MGAKFVVIGGTAIAAYLAFNGTAITHAVAANLTAAKPAATTAVASKAVAFAQAQIGAPYVWGGNGPKASGFDCSGLVTQAYGGTIQRTSQSEWASEPHIAASQVQVGDLVFFTGALQPGESPPGHVGIVVNPATHTMIDAYDKSTGVEYDTYGLPTSKQGLTDPTGFARPAVP
jgi:cell wall-associated NlpC family hydrolase